MSFSMRTFLLLVLVNVCYAGWFFGPDPKECFLTATKVSTNGDVIITGIQSCLDAGWDVNAKNYDGYMALHIAAREGKVNAIAALIKAGADVNAKTDDSSSSSAAEEILQRLKDKEAKDLLAKESKQCECGTNPIGLSTADDGYFAIIFFKAIACGAYKLICNYGGHGLVLSLIFFVLPLCISGFKCRYICPILFVLLLFFIYDYVNTISTRK